jgi:hypothetical protein
MKKILALIMGATMAFAADRSLDVAWDPPKGDYDGIVLRMVYEDGSTNVLDFPNGVTNATLSLPNATTATIWAESYFRVKGMTNEFKLFSEPSNSVVVRFPTKVNIKLVK